MKLQAKHQGWLTRLTMLDMAETPPSGEPVLASSGYVPLREAQDLRDQGNRDSEHLCSRLTHQTIAQAPTSDLGIPVQNDPSLFPRPTGASPLGPFPRWRCPMVHTLSPKCRGWRGVGSHGLQQYDDTWEVCAGASLAMWPRTRWEEMRPRPCGGRGGGCCDSTLWHRLDSEF